MRTIHSKAAKGRALLDVKLVDDIYFLYMGCRCFRKISEIEFRDRLVDRVDRFFKELSLINEESEFDLLRKWRS
jgi:hypothetical protein